jgi:tetratricopeptide (TPR) repeat protein
VHNDIRRLWSIAACALAISLAVMNLPTTAAPAPVSTPAKPAATGDLDRASALFDKGKYAKAKEILDGFLAAPPAGVQPQELRKAQLLLDRVKGVLADQYQAVEAALRRAKADESKRAQESQARQTQEKQMLAESDLLAQKGQYEEARRLRIQVASDRAADTFNLAMDYYDEGLYDNARKALEHLSKFIEDQRHTDPQFQSGLGVEREQRIAEYLEKIPDAKDNLVQAALLAKASPVTPPAGPSEAQRTALKAYEEGLRAFDSGRFDEARRQFDQILNSGVSLGKEKDEQLRAKLNQIAQRQKDIENRRAAALAEMKSGEDLLDKNDWRGAGEFLNKAVMDKEMLTEPQRAHLAGLLTKAADERKKAESLATGQAAQAQAEAEAVKRQEDYLDFVKKQQQILDQQERATAEMYVDLARVDFENNFNYDAALKNITEALNHQPNNAAALKMRAEILALQGKSLDVTVYYERVKSQEKAVIDEVLTQINLAVQRGRADMAAKDYPNAVDQFSRALDSLDYLAPVSDIRMAQSQVKGLLKQAQDAQAEAEVQQKRAREFEALQEREQALREEAERGQRRQLALFAEANAEFAKGKYESAIKLAQEVVEADPENGAARDLIDDARQALERKTWDSIIETDTKAVQDERVRMRMKAIFPGALFM